ncbi:protein tyrosine phosphatase type IVA protein 1 [Achlya hypogyna]|uniref:Protein tyrosine phosphatase type IVA protein 1 n=1 Tax=Achlya hypogyna TaxID=1202772 RepID=A0A1V9ZFE1_ACHHY|nr:protein tyrosine phosphatase type IVA protein 1 [Achlya hypogyna]
MSAPTNKPSHVQYDQLSFLILDAPNDSNLPLYLKEFKKYQVTDIVRACEPTYSDATVEAAGFRVHEMEFPDGEPPSQEIIQKWLALVEQTMKDNARDNAGTHQSDKTVAVHCVAGLGRAPVLVAIALMEHGLDVITAVEHIRKARRGAINLRQLKYLEKYTPTRKKDKCSIM